jgi:hypothetical protein
MLEDWKPFSHIRLVKNPNYWNAAKVAIDAVVFDPTENLATVLKRNRAGEFDIIINGLPNDQLGGLKQNMPKELHLVPYAAVVYYAFNTTSRLALAAQILTRPCQFTHRLVLRVGNPDRREIATTQLLDQTDRIAPIGLHPLARLLQNGSRGRHHQAFVPFLICCATLRYRKPRKLRYDRS